jgi:hypothetical protein
MRIGRGRTVAIDFQQSRAHRIQNQRARDESGGFPVVATTSDGRASVAAQRLTVAR